MRRAAFTVCISIALFSCQRDPAEPTPFAPASAALLSGTATSSATVAALSGLANYTTHVAKSVNASGRAVGQALGPTTSGFPQFFAESFNPGTEVFFASPDHAMEAFSINDAGVIAGFGSLGTSNRTYAGGGNWLPLLSGGVNQFGGYINNAGEVVGMTSFDQNNSLPGHATLWTPNGAGYTATDLGLFNGVSIEPLGIAPNLSGASRIMVGRRISTDGGQFTAVIWQNGAWADLPGAPGCIRNETTANDVSDAGIVVGVEGLCGGGPVVWTSGQYRSLMPACQLAMGIPGGGGDARAITVTQAGRILIVGTCYDQPAVWYDDGQGGYICEILPLLAGDTKGDAFDVNPSGQIVGSTHTFGGAHHAAIWTFTIPGAGGQAPNAVVGGPYIGDEGVAVNLNGSGSSDPDGNALTYDWDFGDGSPHGTGATPSHTYADNGVYSVTLTVSDGTGNTDAATTSVSVANAVPLVNAGAASTIESGQTIAFTGSFSDAGVNDAPWATTIVWGDGSPNATGSTNTQGNVNASHAYFGTGAFTLALTVSDKDGGTGSATRIVTVNPRTVALAASPSPVSLSDRRTTVLDVVILSTATFDATLIDPATVKLGNGADPDATPLQKKNGSFTVSMRDVNRDGVRDLQLSFNEADANLGLTSPSTALVLRGSASATGGSVIVRGQITVNVTP